MLKRTLDLHRQLYNMALEQRRYMWRARRVSISWYDQNAQIKELRNETEFGFLNFSSMTLTLRRLDVAFKDFFRKTCGYPRFKGKNRWASVFYTFGDGIGITKNGRLRVQNIGNIRIFLHRPLPEKDEGKGKIGRIIYERATRRWYVVFDFELPDPEPIEHQGDIVGVDLGISTLAALSTGELIETPHFYRKSQRELRVKQRRVERCKRGSPGRREAARQVAKLHRKIANRRRDFNHKLSRRLIDEFSLIAVEKLNIKGLYQTTLAKSVTDVAWGQLLSFLTYKAESAGSQVIAVDPRYTSQTCSRCGCIVKKDLRVRIHDCSDCGLVLDRDVNAAINILNRALNQARTEPLGVNVDQ